MKNLLEALMESLNTWKSFEEIRKDERDKRVQTLACGCVIQKLGRSFTTPFKCGKHRKAFYVRNRDRKTRGKCQCAM